MEEKKSFQMDDIFKWLDEPSNIQWIKDNVIYFILIAIAIGFIIWFLWYVKSRRRRRHLNFHLHHLSYVLGFRRVMSRHWVSRVHVHECFDPLVDFLPHKNIIFNEETIEKPNLIRKRVLFKLYNLADGLPKGINLLILNTYRSKAKMSEKWNEVLNDVMKENPGIGRHEAIKLAKFRAADPKDNTGGHETGGAVDVALCNDKGEMFDYGTKFHEYNDITFTNSDKLTHEQKENRKNLIKIMRRYGFVNFPAEWWHFSYGDRSWAAYRGLRNGGFYGSAESDMDGKYSFTVPVNRSIHESKK